MSREGRGQARVALAAVALLTGAGCISSRPRAPVAAEGSWFVGANLGGWGETSGPHAGVAEGLQVQYAPVEHLLVGGRVLGMTELEIDLFGDDGRDEAAHVVDIGPMVGTGASLGRLNLQASAGPMFTHVRNRDEGEWRGRVTFGLGADASLSIRIFAGIGLGLAGFANLNGADESAVGAGLRLEGSFFP